MTGATADEDEARRGPPPNAPPTTGRVAVLSDGRLADVYALFQRLGEGLDGACSFECEEEEEEEEDDV